MTISFVTMFRFINCGPVRLCLYQAYVLPGCCLNVSGGQPEQNSDLLADTGGQILGILGISAQYICPGGGQVEPLVKGKSWFISDINKPV